MEMDVDAEMLRLKLVMGSTDGLLNEQLTRSKSLQGQPVAGCVQLYLRLVI